MLTTASTKHAAWNARDIDTELLRITAASAMPFPYLPCESNSIDTLLSPDVVIDPITAATLP